MLKRSRVAGCSRLPLTVGGCRRCRHGCRQAALFLREQSCETRGVPGGEELRAFQRLLQLGDLAAGAARWAGVFGSRSTHGNPAIRQNSQILIRYSTEDFRLLEPTNLPLSTAVTLAGVRAYRLPRSGKVPKRVTIVAVVLALGVCDQGNLCLVLGWVITRGGSWPALLIRVLPFRLPGTPMVLSGSW